MPRHAEKSTLTVEETAQRLGISRTLAYQLAKQDQLPVRTIRLGRRIVIPRLALEVLLSADFHGTPAEIMSDPPNHASMTGARAGDQDE